MMPETRYEIPVRRGHGSRTRFCMFGCPPSRARAMTLIEIIVSLAIMAIVFAVIVPLFAIMRNNWDSKQAAAETLQNGRVLIDHLNRNLSAAVKITDVSGSAETDGYIEYEDNDGNSLRYDINSTGNYAEFGYLGDLSDLAGPVSQLQFSCYDACDLDTPLDISTADVNDIRFVKAETILTNSATFGQDKTLIASAYLRANWNSTSDCNSDANLTYQQFTEAKAASDTTSLTISTPTGGGGGTVSILGSWTSGLSHTAEAGSNRLLVFTAHGRDRDGPGTMDLQSVTYGGQSMTKVIEREICEEGACRNLVYVVAYILDEAGIAAASGNTFSPSWSSTPDQVGYSSVFLNDVDQADPIGASDGATTTTDGAVPLTTGALSNSNGDLVILAATEGKNTGGNFTCNNGFTEALEPTMNYGDAVAGYKAATGSDETPSVTHDDSVRKSLIGFVVQAAAAGGGSIEGDLLIAAVATDGDTSASLAPPGGEGWTEIDVDDYGTEVTLGAWWKNADANESASHEFTWTGDEQAYGWMMRFTGHDSSDPVDVYATSGETSSTPTSPAVTTTVADALILRLGAFDDDDITEDSPGLSGHTAITMDKSAEDAGADVVITAADFETGFGDWVNVTGDDIDWTRDQGGTPSSSTGPSVDHTLGTSSGWYAYTESSTSGTGYPDKVAILEGPELDASLYTNLQLDFWYHMYGSNMGSLHVDVYDGSWNNDVWSLSGNQGNTWFNQQVDLSSFSGTIKIRFRGITGSSYRSDMAIDDIEVTGTAAGGSSDTVSGGAGYVSQPSAGSSGTSTFSLTASEESQMLTLGIAPGCDGQILP